MTPAHPRRTYGADHLASIGRRAGGLLRWMGGHPDCVADPSTVPVRLPHDVVGLLEADPGIDRVELAGSRARGDALPLSDWDLRSQPGCSPRYGNACQLSPRGC